jgi:TRAP-type C4-dicarboxylate transport system permease small subunit
MKTLRSIVGLLTAIFRWLAVASVAAMALLIAASVLMRATATPLGGEHELIELMMVAVVMLGLAYTQKTGGHISIGLLVDRLPPRWQAGLDLLAVVLIAASCLLIGWANLRVAYDYATGSPMSTDFLSIPLYPFKLVVGLGFWLWGLQAIVGLGESVDADAKGEPELHQGAGT